MRCSALYRTHRFAILAISLVALRHNPADRLSARGHQHAHGIRAGQGGLRPAQNGSATSCPALVVLTPKSPSASLQAATKAAYGHDRLSPGHARHLGHLLHHPTHGNHPSPFTATAYPLMDAKKAPQPFSLDYSYSPRSMPSSRSSSGRRPSRTHRSTCSASRRTRACPTSSRTRRRPPRRTTRSGTSHSARPRSAGP